jgi:hypothetical protein
MNGLFIFVAIVVISTVIGAVSRWLKNQQQAEQEKLARERAGGRANRSESSADTFDKYVQEIERLKKKPKADEQRPKPRPAPIPATAKKAKPIPVIPVVKARRKTEDLPIAPVVVVAGTGDMSSPDVARISSVTDLVPIREIRMAGPQVRPTKVPPLTALLTSPQGLATAFVLQEIMGLPMCKRRPM